jgi:hypothetical protein
MSDGTVLIALLLAIIAGAILGGWLGALAAFAAMVVLLD